MFTQKEISDLQCLLRTWKLEHLHRHLLLQKINLDVLLMIKLEHVGALLSDFPLGDQIRFEHNLEIWRRNSGRPLKNSEKSATSALPYTGCLVKQTTLKKNMYTQTLELPCRRINTALPVIIAPTPMLTSTPMAAQTPKPTPMPAQAPKPTPMLIPTPATSMQVPTLTAISSSTSAITTVESNINPPTTKPTISVTTTDLVTHDNVPLIRQYKPFHNIRLREILNACHPKGPNLLRYYAQHKHFQPRQRLELISLLASYFEENNLHLSVQMGHDLEKEIVALFPNEKIDDYRTEKRNKIYMRLSNIKYYKRKARRLQKAAKRDFQKTFETVDNDAYESNSSEENQSMSLDDPISNGKYDKENEIMIIKTEYMDEEVLPDNYFDDN